MSRLIRRVAALATVLWVVALTPGAVGANDESSIDVGGVLVLYDELVTETSDDASRRTMYFEGTGLVAAAWDQNGDGRDDLWFAVDPDWYVVREAVDVDADGVADVVWQVARDGTTTLVDGGTDVSEGRGVPMTLVVGGALVVVAGAAGAVFLTRRRAGPRRPMAAGTAMVMLLPALVMTPGASSSLYDDECNLDETRFEAEWERYSDFDSRIDPADRSYEAQQAAAAVAALQQLLVDHYELEMDIALQHQQLSELRAYREALTRNLKSNLIKSFIRLAALTYSTTKSTIDLGSSFEKLVTSDAAIEVLGATIKIVQSFVPAVDEQKATVRSSVEAVSWDVFVDVLESNGDPKAVVTTAVTSVLGQVDGLLPSVELSDAEIAILRDQHLSQRELDRVMLEAERRIVRTRELIAGNEAEMDSFVTTLDRYRGEERERVRELIIAECRKIRDRDAGGPDTDTTEALGSGQPDDPAVDDDSAPTTSVVPAAGGLLGSWVSTTGDFAYVFGDDGTYTFTTADSTSSGPYRLTDDGTRTTIYFLDPRDPSGMTHVLMAEYRVEGSELVLVIGANETRLVSGQFSG